MGLLPDKRISAEIDFQKIYGRDFECLNHQQPISVMLAEGSEIKVKTKKYLI
jgi:predicted HNH restriction endonuclease